MWLFSCWCCFGRDETTQTRHNNYSTWSTMETLDPFLIAFQNKLVSWRDWKYHNDVQRRKYQSASTVILLIIVARLFWFRAKNGPRGSRPNETGTVRYLRRAVAVERRWGGDLTGLQSSLSCPRSGHSSVNPSRKRVICRRKWVWRVVVGEKRVRICSNI